MCSLNRVSRCHENLVVLFPNKLPMFNILYILALIFCFRNNYYPPISVIVFHLNQPTIRLYPRVLHKQRLPQTTVYLLHGCIDFLFGYFISIPKFQHRELFFKSLLCKHRGAEHLFIMPLRFLLENSYHAFCCFLLCC